MQVRNGEPQNLVFTVPVTSQQLTHNYQIRVANDRFVVDDSIIAVSMHNCVLPSSHRPHTDLLDLDPLPVTVLKNKMFESVYNFQYFNPIQTQVFHCLYNTDQNTLVGAPTGSGKTLCAELAMYRIFSKQPDKKVFFSNCDFFTVIDEKQKKNTVLYFRLVVSVFHWSNQTASRLKFYEYLVHRRPHKHENSLHVHRCLTQ
ncbi:unnamed protein product [Gongylonema pulchrum]|uniref:DEAD/DEAH-box helicase domain-containing protein n=1 Tax=Gongylonema pulchrum TaxID=637853 RepID=A0A3P7R335_9BILA|nr:unnamed protein product [Gongylonema pulchrum]